MKQFRASCGTTVHQYHAGWPHGMKCNSLGQTEATPATGIPSSDFANIVQDSAYDYGTLHWLQEAGARFAGDKLQEALRQLPYQGKAAAEACPQIPKQGGS
jgi:hypothetical protein